MNTLHTLLSVATYWSLIGAVMIVVFPTPRTARGGALIIAVCGPLAWIGAAVGGLVMIWKGQL